MSFKKQNEKSQDFSTSIIVTYAHHWEWKACCRRQSNSWPTRGRGLEVGGVGVRHWRGLKSQPRFDVLFQTPKLLYSLIIFFHFNYSFFHKWYIFIVLSQYFTLYSSTFFPSILSLRVSFAAAAEEIKYVLQTYFDKMCFHGLHSPKACREQNVLPEMHTVWTHKVSSQPHAAG